MHILHFVYKVGRKVKALTIVAFRLTAALDGSENSSDVVVVDSVSDLAAKALSHRLLRSAFNSLSPKSVAITA